MIKSTGYFFAIRHKPSGGFLPQMGSYGFTRTEPSLTEAPRLFAKIGPCKQALDRWLEGEWFEGAPNEDGETKIRVIRRPERRADHMEIVEVALVATSLADSKLRLL